MDVGQCVPKEVVKEVNKISEVPLLEINSPEKKKQRVLENLEDLNENQFEYVKNLVKECISNQTVNFQNVDDQIKTSIKNLRWQFIDEETNKSINQVNEFNMEEQYFRKISAKFQQELNSLENSKPKKDEATLK